MKIAVSNSSPLILLAKIQALEVLFYFYDKIFIPPAVYAETVKNGIEKGEADAFLIKQLVERDKIEVHKPNIPSFLPQSIKSIHQGELDALKLALTFKKDVILLDDEEARIFARSIGLKVKGTLGLLIDSRKLKKISRNHALNLLTKLNKLMYLSGDLYSYVYSKIASIDD